MRKSVRERLFANALINRETGCWEWSAAKDRYGYGRFKIGRKKVKPHRVAYELVMGSIPEGLQLDHLCRVRHCINPAHLEPVTNTVNSLRGTSPMAVNAAKTHCPAGHEYTPENTYLRAKGWRACRKCRTEASARARQLAKQRRDEAKTAHLIQNA